jgi:hypothetical protein
MMAHSGKTRWASLLALAGCMVLGAAAAVACGSEDHPDGWGGTGATGPMQLPEACAEDTTRDCHVPLGERNGVLTCRHGSQLCTDGAWTECEGGTLSEMAAPAGYVPGAVRTLAAATTDASCFDDNPCDPTCTEFEDDDELTPPATVPMVIDDQFDFQWGSLADFAGGLVKKAWNEPCTSGYECQFNSYCNHPDSGDCSHSICEEGEALDASCDWVDKATEWEDLVGCVDSICATGAGAHCCVEESAEECEHDPCVEGDPLKSDCNDCVADICAADPDCCDQSGGDWDADCVAAVTDCGNTCGCADDETLYDGSCYKVHTTPATWTNAKNNCDDDPDWHLATITTAGEQDVADTLADDVNLDLWIGVVGNDPPGTTPVRWEYYDGTNPITYSNWRTTPTNYSTATDKKGAYIEDSDGKWEHATSSGGTAPTKAYLCEGPGLVMADPTPPPTYEWDDTCVDLVYTVCGSRCDTEAPIDSEGVCEFYEPGETDPACAGVNLTVAPLCARDENATPTPSVADDTIVIPICNHGNTDLTQNFYILSFGGYSGKYPLCAPEFDPDNPSDELCLVTTDIPAGQCIEVTDCPVVNNGGIVVNPYIDVDENGSLDNVTECSCLDNWSLVSDWSLVSEEACGDVCGEGDGFYQELVDDCSVPLPTADYGDSDRVTITHFYDNGTGGVDDPVAFTYIADSADCTGVDDGWYYDDPSDPTTIQLCADTCTAVNAANLSPSKLLIQLSCTVPGGYETDSWVYTYQGNCGTDQGVQWMDLTYDGTVPDGTSVHFYVAAAADEADLPTETSPASEWQEVTPSDLSDGCPIESPCDIYDALNGLPDAQLKYLALKITLVPSDDALEAPTLTGWHITYSCPYNQ